jgi:hypothetical protein
MTKFTKHRVGLAAAHHKRAASASCTTGGFYISPTAGQTFDSSNQLNMTWDPTCMQSSAVDIYLYEPGAKNPRIHLWETVANNPGSYEAALKPKWWNSTATVSLQLLIIESGMAPFMATLPAGPVFTATYHAPTSGAPPPNADTSVPESATQVVDNVPKSNHISKGKVAAAVLMPMIVVAAIIAAVYIYMARKKAQKKRDRFSQVVDARMSRISTDWKSMTPAGATAAIRASMAVEGGENRQSSFSFGAIRPASTVALEGGQAGIGAKGVYASSGIDTETPQMSELRSGPRVQSVTGERVSRVSFAVDTRPSVESRRSQYTSRTSRAFHVGHVPPLPTRQDSGNSDLLSPGGLSPTQTAGPFSLSAEDIRDRMSGVDVAPRPSVDEVYPALAMMRTGLVSSDDLLLPPSAPAMPVPEPALPALPAAALQIPKTSMAGIMPMQPMPDSVMSPDEMLRAYAASRAAVVSPPPGGRLSMPSPIADVGSMRTLYSPTTSFSATTPGSPKSAYTRKSLAPTEFSKYDDDDAYVGTAE